MKKRSQRLWTEEERQFLRENYLFEETDILAKELGRTRGQVSSYALKVLGLRRRKNESNRRVCLSCERDFMSEGIHNRICPNCAESPFRPVMEEYQIAAGR